MTIFARCKWPAVVAVVCFALCRSGDLLAASTFTVTSEDSGNLLHVRTSVRSHHLLEIDDAAGFRSPVVHREFTGSKVDISESEAGLIPGLRYQVRMDKGIPQPLMLKGALIQEPGINCERLQATWRQTGRFTAGRVYSQLVWDDRTHKWNPVLPAVAIGESIYNVEFTLRPALSAARACGDLETLDEIALYYVAMLDKTESVATLLKRSNVTQESKDRMRVSDPQARTFVAPFSSGLVGEGELYNSQWMHPAALLLRLISELPDQDRSIGMRTFAAKMTPFIVQDQLLRLLFDQQEPPLGGRANRGRVAHWELSMQGLQGRVHWDTAMSDIDLWLLSSTAEMLGANANDPQLIAVNPDQLAKLHAALDIGVRFFQSKRTLYPETRNFRGEEVGSASYFNGDYDGLSEMRGTAVTGADFPGANAAARPGASWDVAHMYRVAIFLRALYENRKATKSTFPQYGDLQLVVSQYMYKVFTGDYQRPLFHNNFDGSDGWFRVGYNGPDFGQPPSTYCDMRNAQRPCMAPGSIFAWAELSFANSDLSKLQMSLIRIALDENPANRGFCDRYYFWLSPFGLIMSEGKQVYGGAFYAVAAENADRIARN